MGLNCACPPAASLPTVTIPQCLESFGQINKVVFQRIVASAGIKNKISASFNAKATWTPFFTASDGTKMVISPFVSNPEVTPGAKKTYGGGNATPGGATLIIGAETTTVTARMDNMPQSVVKAMKTLMCEELGVYLINERGDVAAIGETVPPPGGIGDPTVEYSPIPISSLFIGDKGLGGLDEPDYNAIEWEFKPDWSDNLRIVKVDFDPLTELTNA